MYGLFTYIYRYHKNQLNVVKYTSPMDPLGLMVQKSGLKPVEVDRFDSLLNCFVRVWDTSQVVQYVFSIDMIRRLWYQGWE